MRTYNEVKAAAKKWKASRTGPIPKRVIPESELEIDRQPSVSMDSDRLDRMWEECVGGQPSPKDEAEPYKTFRRDLKKTLKQMDKRGIAPDPPKW